MGKKRALDADAAKSAAKRVARWWCYYCNHESKDETALVQHQRSKHFRCPHCDVNAPGGQCQSLEGLVSHVRRSHSKRIDQVPGAIEGRTSIEVQVYGMAGIPDDMLSDAEEDADAPVPADPLLATPSPKAVPPVKSATGPSVADLLSGAGSIAASAINVGSTGTAANSALLLGQLLANASRPPSAIAPQLGITPLPLTAQLLTGTACAPTVLGLPPLPAVLPLPSLGPLGGPLPAVTSAAPVAVSAGLLNADSVLCMVYGGWRHSSGGEIAVAPAVGDGAGVVVKHYLLGEQKLQASSFVVGGKLRFAGHEGVLQSAGLIRWSNGATWTKVS